MQLAFAQIMSLRNRRLFFKIAHLILPRGFSLPVVSSLKCRTNVPSTYVKAVYDRFQAVFPWVLMLHFQMVRTTPVSVPLLGPSLSGNPSHTCIFCIFLNTIILKSQITQPKRLKPNIRLYISYLVITVFQKLLSYSRITK